MTTEATTTGRSSHQRRMTFAPRIAEWTNFDKEVKQYTPPTTVKFPSDYNYCVFFNSIIRMRKLQSVDMERIALLGCLEDALVETKLVSKIVDAGTAGINVSDATSLYRKGSNKPVIVCEFKSSPNLPLHKTMEELVHAYSVNRKPATKHIVGQLLNTMVANACRFGVISSASRTYFVRVTRINNADIEKVEISRAWFVGEKNYIKAWAYLFDLGCKDDQSIKLSRSSVHRCGWTSLDDETESGDKASGSVSTENDDRKRSGDDTCSGRGQRPRTETGVGTSDLATLVPIIAPRDIEILDFIAPGRNGWTIKALWKGNEVVAVKQYSLERRGGLDAFMAETAAYAKLQDAWGVLVPKPLFLLDWGGGVYFLGMQLGRDAEDADESQRMDILQKLEQEYGFHHLDVEIDNDRNFLFIPSSGDGESEILVVIDLEDHEFVSVH